MELLSFPTISSLPSKSGPVIQKRNTFYKHKHQFSGKKSDGNLMSVALVFDPHLLTKLVMRQDASGSG